MQAVRQDPTSPDSPVPADLEAGSVSPDEIARFGALAARWWDPNGPMRPLHQMNRLRVRWIDRHLAGLSNRSSGARLSLLDLGCGAGLASESLAANGHDVLGVDASIEAIAAAEAHQAIAAEPRPSSAGALSYRSGSAEMLVLEGRRFDAVVALEVIEHVSDPADFLVLLGKLLVPGGIVFISTLNRTWRSLITAKIGAEYVLGLLPVGTHDWHRFVTPAELGRHAGLAGLRVSDISGMVPSANGWRESHDTSVNYIALIGSR